VAPTGDVYFIDLGLVCTNSGCDTVDDGGALFKVSFDNGTPSTPVKIASGLNFPTSATICDASTQVCPEPVSQNTPVVQPTAGEGG